MRPILLEKTRTGIDWSNDCFKRCHSTRDNTNIPLPMSPFSYTNNKSWKDKASDWCHDLDQTHYGFSLGFQIWWKFAFAPWHEQLLVQWSPKQKWSINNTWYEIACIRQNHTSMAYIDGLMQENCNSIANTLELCLSCINPSRWHSCHWHLQWRTKPWWVHLWSYYKHKCIY